MKMMKNACCMRSAGIPAWEERALHEVLKDVYDEEFAYELHVQEAENAGV